MDRATPLYIEILAGQRLWFQPNLATSFTIDLIEYSYDAVSWSSFIRSEVFNDRYYIDVNVGDKIYIRAKSSSGYYWETATHFWNFQIERHGSCNLGGNIMSLIYGDQFTGDEVSFPMNTKNNFRGIFQYLNVIDASQLLLPSTNLTDGCYRELFGSTTLNASTKTLVKAPTITQATLPTGGYPYDYMFAKCDNLESLTIENTNIRTSDWILDNMSPKTIVYKKENVGSLRNPNNLTIVTLKSTPFNIHNAKRWVINNKDVKKVVDSLNRLIWERSTSYSEAFYVENIGDRAETVSISIFEDRETAPRITVETSTDGYTWTTLGTTGTTSLTFSLPVGSKVYMRANANTWGGVSCGNCIRGCSKVGGNIMSLLYGSRFTGYETVFPEDSVGQFRLLFYNNSTLKDASNLILPVPILTNYCYADMFLWCSELITAPEMMLAKTLVDSSCGGMFTGCSKLNKITMYADDISANNCLHDWVNGVAATGTFRKRTSTTYPTGVSGIPSGWTVVDL